MPPARAPIAAVVAAVAVVAGCGAAPSTEARLLGLVPGDVEVVVAVAPARVRDTWLDRGAAVYAAGLPACVRERARAAEVVVWAWRPDGWLLLMAGRAATAAGCDALEVRGDVAWARDHGAPRASGAPGFFTAERRRRWRALGTAAPVRALGDVEVSSGITARGAATLDPRDGIDGRVAVQFDDRAAASGAVERLARWRAALDRDRLGGAWPAFAAVEARVDPIDPTRVTATLRVASGAGSDAAAFAIAALAAGGLDGAPRAPCPKILDDWAGRVTCTAPGRFALDAGLRDEALADPAAILATARVVPAFKNGRPHGFKLFSIRPNSLLAALGLLNGDVVRSIAGAEVTTSDRAADVYGRVRDADRIDVEVERRGELLTLTYRIR